MFKEDTIMKKTLRYLLMAIAVLGVLSVSAQTHQYGATHYSSHEQTVYTGVHVNPQMPAATMDYRHSDYMTSGSTLPQAALDGPTTTYDQNNSSGGHKGHIRKGWGTGGGGEPDPGGEPGDWDDPYADPIGDAGWPLMLLALAYLGVRIFLNKKRA